MTEATQLDLLLRKLIDAETFLFVPGDRPERVAKALVSDADVVVVDLEDAVADDRKDAARNGCQETLRGRGEIPVVIRVNDPLAAAGSQDLHMVAELGDVAVMVPKAEGVRVAEARDRLLDTPVLPLVESARGLVDVNALADTAGVVRLCFGPLDLAAELGVEPTVDRLAPARFAVVMASAAAGLPAPVDGPSTVIDDPAVVEREARAALEQGFRAKLCVHPAQLAATRAGLAPSAGDVEWARSVLDAAGEDGLGRWRGGMVDRPVVDRARQILARLRPS